MANVNIGGTNDPFFRYKRPKLIIKSEGKGNGVKTVLPNVVEVCEAIERSPEDLMTWFGHHLGARSGFDKVERAVVNGHHDASVMEGALESFIQVYVLCGVCKNPETVLELPDPDVKGKKDKKACGLCLRCTACGRKTTVDPEHKLNNVIARRLTSTAVE